MTTELPIPESTITAAGPTRRPLSSLRLGVLGRTAGLLCLVALAGGEAAADQGFSGASTGQVAGDSEVGSVTRSKTAQPPAPQAAPQRAVSGFKLLNGDSSSAMERVANFATITRSADGSTGHQAAPEAVLKRLQRPRVPSPQARPQLGPGGGAGQKQIIGTDDRVYIADTSSFPFRAIGLIYAEYPDGGGTCSGTMIAANAVLTAAHCLFDREADDWVLDLTFYPALSGRNAPYGGVGFEELLIPSGYPTAAEGEEYNYDIGLIILDQDIGDRIGWLAYGYNDALPRFTGNIVGYPGDKDQTMWRSSCEVDPQRGWPNFLESECDTYAGTSGSAIYDYDPAVDDRVIFGVHIAARTITRGDYVERFNYGLRITSAWFDWLGENIRNAQ